ncbi:baseplate J/gp47 family protein [Myxococcus landrumensis]|uniref:baseplate J/gp47 family protein n=1 Tax=Myxococcus landrumensis TaxID=2813577 RepID=UPI001F508A73|nr:baseplate J/gp47 family protein [Myxococcus landrumus]
MGDLLLSLYPPDQNTFSAIVERLLGNLGPGMDPNVGGMARTLAEAYAREMATFYAMMELSHRAGYLDTAEGPALDNVVAVLGLKRARAGRLMGEVELSRITPAPDDIGIPAGRQVTGLSADGKPLPLFETMEDATLVKGDTRVIIPVQEVQDEEQSSREAPPAIDPFRVTLMPRPILGIEAVTNPAPLRRGSDNETDENLRARARTALRDGEKGTLESLAAAVQQQGVRQVTVREPADAPPGVVDVLVGDTDFEADVEGVARVEAAIRETKAAGIRVRLRYARTIFFRLSFSVEPTREDLDEVSFGRLRRDLQQALAQYMQEQPVGSAVIRRKLEAVLYGNPAVRRVSNLSVETYVWGLVGTPPTRKDLVLESQSREYGANRDWKMEPLEVGRIDLVRLEPRISRLRTPQWRLDLVVSLSSGEARTPEQVREALRGALGVFAARLSEEAQVGREAFLTWDSLQLALKSQARIQALLGCDVTLETGITVSLVAPSTPAAAIPDQVTQLLVKADVRLEFGGAELVGVG